MADAAAGGGAVEQPAPWATQAITAVRRTVELLGPEACCLSFNGGKDSTVILHLLRETFPETYKRLTYCYFNQEHEFPEVFQFIDDASSRYAIEMHNYKGTFKECLATLLEQRSNIKCIFVGTRRGDPHGAKLGVLQLTDEGWPNIIRVHPIIDWTYQNVWEYLRGPDRPYCTLYDQGYTSLGSTLDTQLNPQLRNADGTYRPAYMLTDEGLERHGRGSRKAEAPSN